MKILSRRLVTPLIIFTIFFAIIAFIQFSTPNLPDNDGFYHIKMAWLMRTEGLKPAFPWLPQTILNPREFYDHHFLFHVAMIPFTFGDLATGAKWSAVLFASLAFLSIWYLLDQQKVSYSWLWALGLLAISEAFIYRMSIPRAQSLSLAVLVLGINLMFNGKNNLLALLAFGYVWLYDAFPLLMAMAMLYSFAILVTETRLDLRPVLYTGLGTLLGILINPYFPYNIVFAYHHMLPKLVDATSIRVGSEWYPYTTGQLLENSPLSLVAFVMGILALGLSGRKIDARTTLSLLAAVFYGLMLFEARRFIEYFPPFALIFTAFACSPLLVKHPDEPKAITFRIIIQTWLSFLKKLVKSADQPLPLIQPSVIRFMTTSLLMVIIIFGTIFTFKKSQASLNTSSPVDRYAGSSAWLVKNTPAGARVFQTDWDDFPRLFYYNTHNTYLVGLDPTYLQIADPNLFDLWLKVTKGNVDNLSEVITKSFAAEYIHSDLNHSDFIRAASNDPAMKEVYRDKDSVLFQIIKK
jgi:hypothetical protein